MMQPMTPTRPAFVPAYPTTAFAGDPRLTVRQPMVRNAVGSDDAAGRLAFGLGLVLVLGVTGYAIGAAVAPDKKSKKQYAAAGAVSNIFVPVLGPLVVAGIGLAKS